MNIYTEIDALRVISNDLWLEKRIKEVGESIYTHPNYLVLKGRTKLFDEWMKSVGRDSEKRLTELMRLMKSIKEKGQINYIVINEQQQILNGHKRTAVMAFLGYKLIKVKIQ